MEPCITGHSDRSDIGADSPDRATASVVDVTADMALRFALLTGEAPELYLNMQIGHGSRWQHSG